MIGRVMILGGAVLAAAGLALLQIGALAQSGKMYRVGLVSVGAPDSGILGPGMVRDFGKRGYAVDRDIVFDRRAAEGHSNRLPSLVAELVADHVDLIITQSYPAAAAAKERAGKIPIVVTNSGDPVATGLAASLAHPGGNVTGVSDVASELSAKRLALLKEPVPNVRAVAVLWNADDLGMTLRYRAAEVEAKRLGMQIVPLGVHAPDDFDAAFWRDDREAARRDPDGDRHLDRAQPQAGDGLPAAHRLPAIYEYAFLAHDGGLMAYGPNMDAIFDRAAGLADQILKGASPADLLLELPTRFDLAVNLKTAKTLDLTIPESVLVRADDVIE